MHQSALGIPIHWVMSDLLLSLASPRKPPLFRSISWETSYRTVKPIHGTKASGKGLQAGPADVCRRKSITSPSEAIMMIDCCCVFMPQALGRTHALGNSQALEAFVQELLNLHRGQGRDILWRDSNRCPTEVEYESMVLDSECASSARSSSRARLEVTCLLSILSGRFCLHLLLRHAQFAAGACDLLAALFCCWVLFLAFRFSPQPLAPPPPSSLVFT